MHTALKSLVIGLGLLIASGLGFLIYGFIKKSDDPGWRPFGGSTPPMVVGPAATPAMPAAQISGDIKLDLPIGCQIRDVRPAGQLLYVLTGPAAVCGQVLVVDPAAKRVIGRLIP